jgi:hypothetical protein
VPIRLWPAGAAGAFDARARPDVSASTCVVTASIADVGEGRADLRVTPDAPAGERAGEGLPEVVARTGGMVVPEREVSRLITGLRAGRVTDRVPEIRHPMRSFWWMFPFVACLAGEWWLRRRSGLR